MSSTKLTLTNRPRLKKIHRSDQNFAKSGHNAWKVYFFIPTNNRKGTIFKPNLSYTFYWSSHHAIKLLQELPLLVIGAYNESQVVLLQKMVKDLPIT